jgi:copper chaperone CopZ
MSCEHCVRAVTNALKGIGGVKEVTVSLEETSAKVTFEESETSLDALKAAIVEEGYSTEKEG